MQLSQNWGRSQPSNKSIWPCSYCWIDNEPSNKTLQNVRQCSYPRIDDEIGFQTRLCQCSYLSIDKGVPEGIQQSSLLMQLSWNWQRGKLSNKTWWRCSYHTCRIDEVVGFQTKLFANAVILVLTKGYHLALKQSFLKMQKSWNWQRGKHTILNDNWVISELTKR